MDAGDQIKALQAEVEKWKQLAQDLHYREQRKWTRSPAFSTYIELKEGPAGRVLAALQDGLISRNKAAEALAEIAHGATEVSMPEPSDIFGLDEIPAETVVKLRAQIPSRNAKNARTAAKIFHKQSTISSTACPAENRGRSNGNRIRMPYVSHPGSPGLHVIAAEHGTATPRPNRPHRHRLETALSPCSTPIQVRYHRKTGLCY